MIFMWFFKLILFCLKRFIVFLADFQVLLVLMVLFLVLLFLVYKEVKEGIEKAGGIYLASKTSFLSSFWGFLSLIVPGLDKVTIQNTEHHIAYSSRMRIGRISLN
ncbi:hypothetical protein AUJ66_06190 [Candidatus Desantisbacteria bacterium CG1_02_38_46]|uniref:Uncharacterized protein n=3 Tax=unclassified Candidatus Desantisiibacteriota TaxID=3106372 RepID=A0A2H9P9Y6_9BACT|nr:MAG: hypothetical protein AUJ66_06190 [Candidatus Desantisbacteria bacterium CG1_02_38_46]PIU50878.1 MAG: hypothetical protein COS91_07345 [Candidatus Desantisbacteria bacterium CG07_land_8_20_14_0_80_39_15]PIZ15096.1 MAG: hypothetical protein COY51_06285 [Candidatus Desantisbacteria bacterium CG_4_10_14_0_8_um_filter_39_17]